MMRDQAARQAEQRLVSVIIPVCNGAATLPAQLDALRAQEYSGPWEVIVVDNRSRDGTAQLVRDYQRRLPQLRLVAAPERPGRSYACNVGAQAGRGAAFIFCDCDDLAAPGWLAAMAEALQEHDLVCGAIEVERLNQTTVWRPPPQCGAQHPILGFLPFVVGCNMGVSRAAFEAVGGFAEDPPFSQDVELSWRLQLHGYLIHDAPAAVMHYRYRTTWRSLWRQTAGVAEAHVGLYKRFARYGMPRSSTRAALGKYGELLREAPTMALHKLLRQGLRDPARLRQDRQLIYWMLWGAICWGRLRGSLRYRSVYL